MIRCSVNPGPRTLPILLFSVVLSAIGATTVAAVDVWVDFTSDFHNGANGPPNGIADWIDELNDATGAAPGVPDFTAAERAQIESIIVANLQTMYAGYDINFVTSEPAGEHDVIYMARDNDHPDVSSN